VLLGIVGSGSEPPRPDPAEVAALRWVAPADLLAALDERPDDFAPWLAGVTAVAVPALGEVS
jgi:isopentenyl-diphosphate delta-isomerase